MLCAGVLTLLLHATLIVSAIGYASTPPAATPRENSGAGSIEIISDQTPVMTVIFLDEPSPVQQVSKPQTLETLASRGFAPDELIKLLSPDGEPTFDADKGSTLHAVVASASLDAAQRAVLFGRYLGQVDARIERGWQKPRSPIGAAQFKCQVMVKQDRDGNIRGTALLACNGDERWQLSLIHAIQRASPLPSPPDQRVFADALTLTFNALP